MVNELASAADRQLRVLCCSGSLDGGGSERQLWQLACKLDRECFSPSVYLLYRRGPYIDQLPQTSTCERSGTILMSVNASFRPHSSIADCSSNKNSSRTTNGCCLRSHVPHDARHQRGSTSRSRAASLRDRQPTERDFQKSRERFRWFKRTLLRRAYAEKGSVTVAVSDEVAADAAEFYRIDRSRIRVMPNPVDLDAIRQAANSEDRRFSASTNITRIAVADDYRMRRDNVLRSRLQFRSTKDNCKDRIGYRRRWTGPSRVAAVGCPTRPGESSSLSWLFGQSLSMHSRCRRAVHSKRTRGIAERSS